MEYLHQDSIEGFWGLLGVTFGLTGIVIALMSRKVKPYRFAPITFFVSVILLSSGLLLMINASLRHQLVFPQKKQTPHNQHFNLSP